MMLQRVGNNGVVSPDFRIENAYPASLKYWEGERTLAFPTEMTTLSHGVHVFDYPSVREWLPPFAHEILSDAHKRLVLVRVTAALRVLGLKAIWIATSPSHERDDWEEIGADAEALLNDERLTL